MKRRRKRRGAVATLANSLPHPILQAALAECARFGAQLSPITIELFEKDTMPDTPISTWNDPGLWPATEIAWPCCSTRSFAPARCRRSVQTGTFWQCPHCSAELANHTLAAAYPFAPFVDGETLLGDVFDRDRLQRLQLSHAALAQQLENAETLAPLEAIQRLTVHDPMRDVRNLATAYIDLVLYLRAHR